MMDDDIVAVSPSSVYRVLHGAGLLRRWNGKALEEGHGRFVQPVVPHEHWHAAASYLIRYGAFWSWLQNLHLILQLPGITSSPISLSGFCSHLQTQAGFAQRGKSMKILRLLVYICRKLISRFRRFAANGLDHYQVIKHYFDSEYYLKQLADTSETIKRPAKHYLTVGWLQGYNPSQNFDGQAYLSDYPDVARSGMNPLYHYAKYGRHEGRKIKKAADVFDEEYYLENYPDIDLQGMDPFEHFMKVGWREMRNPGPCFNTREYLIQNPDVNAKSINPFLHYRQYGKAESRSLGTFSELLRGITDQHDPSLLSFSEDEIMARAQDMMIPMDVVDTERLCVMVVPELNAMSGGVYSIFSIANHLRRTRHIHGYDVIVMTLPNMKKQTYLRNRWFRNSETVLRFDHLRVFRNVRDLQLHIPEYRAVDFMRNLSRDLLNYLRWRDNLHINILNQNIRLMPEREQFADLKVIADTIGQSVAHHAYATQEIADRYNLPTLLLPAYTDLSLYASSNFDGKENLIIYSHDQASYRGPVLKRLEELDDYRLVEIQGISFDKYMDLATRCRFSISFGEGFDGYVAQPIYQGGIGFALYNDDFFPNERFKQYENFFESESEMISQIVPAIRRLEADRDRYEALNSALQAEWEAIYSYDDYLDRIIKLVQMEYEFLPECTADSPKRK
jgi:hypothetical protein